VIGFEYIRYLFKNETLIYSGKKVNIVSSEDTLGGYPRVEGTRIGIHHIYFSDDSHFVGLTEEQKQEIIEFCKDNIELIKRIEKQEDTVKKLNKTKYICECGIETKDILHFSKDGHIISDEKYLYSEFECTCGRNISRENSEHFKEWDNKHYIKNVIT
jgi:uncharacterized protein (DUF433 family)